MTKALVRPDTVINGTSMAFGEADLITDTTLHEGDYRAIEFLEDTVFETLTSACDYGRVMNDGRTACQVPKKFKDEFMKYAGIELNLESGAFPKVVNEV